MFNDVLHAETGNIVPVKDAMTNSASGVYVAMINLENKMNKTYLTLCTWCMLFQKLVYLIHHKGWILVKAGSIFFQVQKVCMNGVLKPF